MALLGATTLKKVLTTNIYIHFKHFVKLYLIYRWQIWSVITVHQLLFPNLLLYNASLYSLCVYGYFSLKSTHSRTMFICWALSLTWNFGQSFTVFRAIDNSNGSVCTLFQDIGENMWVNDHSFYSAGASCYYLLMKAGPVLWWVW